MKNNFECGLASIDDYCFHLEKEDITEEDCEKCELNNNCENCSWNHSKHTKFCEGCELKGSKDEI